MLWWFVVVVCLFVCFETRNKDVTLFLCFLNSRWFLFLLLLLSVAYLIDAWPLLSTLTSIRFYCVFNTLGHKRSVLIVN